MFNDGPITDYRWLNALKIYSFQDKKLVLTSAFSNKTDICGVDIIDNRIYYATVDKLSSLDVYKIVGTLEELELSAQEGYVGPREFHLTTIDKKSFVIGWGNVSFFLTDSKQLSLPSADFLNIHPLQTTKGIVSMKDDGVYGEIVCYVERETGFQQQETGVEVLSVSDNHLENERFDFWYDNAHDTFFVRREESKDKTEGFYVLYRKNEKEPALTITKKLDLTTQMSIDQFKNKFLKSKLVSRFENNWWFASGNTLFRTENNDPTYIPLDEEFELGDTKDPVTGFNIAQDNLLLAYKKNNIYAIQPYEAYDRLTYSILETKNVSGNNAIGSPIVTALTEMPVHISYDGIFALKQLRNVQSSDRISELISDNINKRWLKESKSAIDTCQTINRLYWTYFVLKERDVTKVYLLDNRTQSWFYWELPITCINVFVKDETTIFVDENGMVYKLTTDDIINEYNKDVTEYYDNGKKLIKWFWKSSPLFR